MRVSLVLVSHSAKLAEGLAEVSGQMAPNVQILPAGGTDDDGIGTSLGRIERAITTGREGGREVLVLGDIGSALMTAEIALEEMDGRAVLADVPFVEGAVAAAVAAEGGAGLDEVHAAGRGAIDMFDPPEAPAVPNAPNAPTGEASADAIVQTLTLRNTLGLHARPAAMVARIAAEYDAKITVNGADAASVLALMGLALPGGAEVELAATGKDARVALEALVPQFEEGFGEE